jgi:molybdate transport system regulatory protein
MTISQSLRLRLHLNEVIAFGPGKAALLQGIERTGSISAAARAMNMSYRRAWLLIEDMNRCFRQPLVETSTGGAHGGGSRLTGLGREVLNRYLAMERRALDAVEGDMAYLKSLLVDDDEGR